LIPLEEIFMPRQNPRDWLTSSMLLLLVINSASTTGAAIPLQNATATYSQASFGGQPIGQAIDGSLGDHNGWAIYEGPTDCCGAIPGNTNSQIAVFETASDISSAGGASLTLTLQNSFYVGTHGLGRFRLSATTDARSTFADGLATGGDVTAAWTVLAPLSANSTNGTTLSILGDDSILAGGANPVTSTYTVTAHTPLVGITGFRLEVLADGSFSDSGPGRNSNGNFVLTEFQVNVDMILGDFDFDGDVDGRDFLIWQRNPSVGDLGDWQTNYGVGPSTAAADSFEARASPVPEPSSLVGLVFLALFSSLLHRARGSATYHLGG
jgi:hypothetical protein